MSREELVEAYVDGRVGRRVFMKSLVALGVSAAAAVTYADALSAAVAPTAGAAAIADGSDGYDMYDMGTETGSGSEGDGVASAGAARPVSSRPRFTG